MTSDQCVEPRRCEPYWSPYAPPWKQTWRADTFHTQSRGGWESAFPPHPTKDIMSKANDIQVGGVHYKQSQYETWDVINDWGLGYFDGNAVKYLSRWRHKGGIDDLRKAKHYIEKLIELEVERGAYA